MVALSRVENQKLEEEHALGRYEISLRGLKDISLVREIWYLQRPSIVLFIRKMPQKQQTTTF